MRWSTYVKNHLTPMLAAGQGSLLLGILSIFEPVGLLESIRWVLAVQLAGLGLLTLGPWVIGRVQQGPRVHGGLPIGLQATAALALAVAFASPRTVSMPLLGGLVLCGLLVDGGVQLFLALRRPFRWTKLGLMVSGAVTVGVALFAVSAGRSQFWALIGPLVGIKLGVFGLALLGMARSAVRDQEPTVYGAMPFEFGGERRVGEAYAVYIGNAFHLGLYVGDDEVVDFRNDDLVYLSRWGDFLLGRRPVHWEYPDLPAVDAAAVAAYARREVGRRYRYNFLDFNCEHFVIGCKTLGAGYRSRFAQMGLAESLFEESPIMGSVLEVHTRFLGWIAYLIGGRLGRKLSLGTRYGGALIASRVVGARRRLRRRGAR